MAAICLGISYFSFAQSVKEIKGGHRIAGQELKI